MKRLLVFLILLSSVAYAQTSPLRVEQLRVEYKTNPVGIDVILPRFSWKLVSSVRNTMQKSYQIQVAKDEKFSKKSVV